VVVALTGSEAIWSLMGFVFIALLYLGIAVSKLREKIARMEGKFDRNGRNGGR
jgi:hypothetical protein